jgi:HAD superfamily hydrolase (TIGR01509 family)
MRKFLLWDHDGVLVDTEKLYFAAIRQCMISLGCEFQQSTYLELMAHGHNYWDDARRRGNSEAAIQEARRKRDQLYQQYLSNNQIEIEGVVEVLRELSARHRMAIVTTSRREDFDLIHRSRQIRQYFEFVVTVEDCANAKPAPDPYLEALHRFNAPPSEALAIEDSSRGLRSAIAAGVDCVIIRNAFTATQDFSGAHSILDSVRELPLLLKSIKV